LTALCHGSQLSLATALLGPAKTQSTNGVIDILVEDDKAAMLTAKKVMSYFQGATNTFQAADQKVLQEIIPTERRRVYQIRDIIETLCDTDSVTELKSQHARSAVTCFVRIAGKPYGLIANDCRREAGAITAAAADKLTNFLSLCGKYHRPARIWTWCHGDDRRKFSCYAIHHLMADGSVWSDGYRRCCSVRIQKRISSCGRSHRKRKTL